jgi:hypothetical protein
MTRATVTAPGQRRAEQQEVTVRVDMGELAHVVVGGPHRAALSCASGGTAAVVGS